MEIKINSITNLSALTKLPVRILNLFTSKINLCIGRLIKEAIANKEKNLKLDIGIGLLDIDLVDMQCSFIPSDDLEKFAKINTEQNIDVLEKALEKQLADRLVKLCQESL